MAKSVIKVTVLAKVVKQGADRFVYEAKDGKELFVHRNVQVGSVGSIYRSGNKSHMQSSYELVMNSKNEVFNFVDKLNTVRDQLKAVAFGGKAGDTPKGVDTILDATRRLSAYNSEARKRGKRSVTKLSDRSMMFRVTYIHYVPFDDETVEAPEHYIRAKEGYRSRQQVVEFRIPVVPYNDSVEYMSKVYDTLCSRINNWGQSQYNGENARSISEMMEDLKGDSYSSYKDEYCQAAEGAILQGRPLPTYKDNGEAHDRDDIPINDELTQDWEDIPINEDSGYTKKL